jgi:O-antigen ligase
VALSPIPFGSNRPYFAALLGVAVGASGLAYMVSLARSEEKLPPVLKGHAVPAALFILLVLYLLFQLLPLGSLAGPIAFGAAGGTSLHAKHMSLAPGDTLLMLCRQLTYGGLFLLVIQLCSRPGVRSVFLHGLFVVVAAYGLYGLVALFLLGDRLLTFEKWGSVGVATATFVNRNHFATFVGFGIVTGTVLLLQRVLDPHAKRRANGAMPSRAPQVVALSLLLAVLIAALLATQSRLGLVATAAGLLSVFVVAAANSSRRRLIIATGASVLAAGALVGGLFLQPLMHRFADLSSDPRFELYGQVMDMIRARPLLGYGGGSFPYAFPLFHLPPLNTDLIWDKAHSTYLALWVELGLVVGTIPILLVAWYGNLCLMNFLRQKQWNAAQLCAVGVTVTAAVHSLGDFSLEIPAVSILFVAILGCAVSALPAHRGHAGR